MTIRRWIALALLIALAVTTAPPSSRAQIPMLAQGLVMSTVASVNAANTTAEILLYQYPIPGALLASWTSANTAFGSVPIHLRLNGTIRTSGSSPTATLGVNLGGVNATTVVINGNALPQDLGGGTACGGAAVGVGACFAPFTVDVIFSPIATLTSQNATDLRPTGYSVFMTGRAVMSTTSAANTGGATESVFNSATLGQININQATTTLNVVWRWGAAASVNAVNIYNGVLKLGY